MDVMNTILWVCQAILSVKLLSVAFSHGLRHGPEMRQGIQSMGSVARRLLPVSATAMLLTVAGLVAAAAFPVPSWVAPTSAAVLAGLMLPSTTFHAKCRRQPRVFVSIVLLAMAAFVAYGRWVLSPF